MREVQQDSTEAAENQLNSEHEGQGFEEGIERITITPPNVGYLLVSMKGVEAYVQQRMTARAQRAMRKKMELGDQARKNIKREPRRFAGEFAEAMYRGPKGERGIPTNALRDAAISACKVKGFAMTRAKLSIQVVPDFYDELTATPLVKINGRPKRIESVVRNSGRARPPDIRTRAMWAPG
jgi:hypothetical protein